MISTVSVSACATGYPTFSRTMRKSRKTFTIWCSGATQSVQKLSMAAGKTVKSSTPFICMTLNASLERLFATSQTDPECSPSSFRPKGTTGLRRGLFRKPSRRPCFRRVLHDVRSPNAVGPNYPSDKKHRTKMTTRPPCYDARIQWQTDLSASYQHGCFRYSRG